MKLKMMFSIVAVLTVIFAAAVFGVQYIVPETSVGKVTTAQTTEIMPAITYATTEIVEYDAEREMEYIYVQSQNVNGDPEELDSIQQHLYDIAEDYDPVEYDFLQEQVDNEQEEVDNEQAVAKSIPEFNEQYG